MTDSTLRLACPSHDVDLPTILPATIAALLDQQVDPGDRVAVHGLAERLVWAVWVAGVLDEIPRATDRHACAVLRRHPGLVAYGARSTAVALVCVLARRYWGAPPDRTELGTAQRLLSVHGADLAYTPGLGGWQVWSGTCWETDPDRTAVTARTLDVITRLLPDEIGGDDTKRAAGAAYAMRAQTAKHVRAAVELARAGTGVVVPADVWDAAPRLLATANGTVELGDGEAKIREHRREDRLTRVTRAAYRPQADLCVWEKFVADLFPDPAVRERVQRLVGYTLMRGNPERLLIILIGPTSTGKSTFVETVAHVLGEYAGPCDLAIFRGGRDGGGARADLLAALPRRMIHTSEASDRWELHADAVKRLTGGDKITARGLYARTAIEAVPAFTPWISTNAAPRVIGADDALWRRLEVVPVDRRVAREDPGLGERLRRDEADGVLAWAVQGWIAYSRDGLGQAPPACVTAQQRVRADMDLVDTWLAECCETDPDGVEPIAALATSYQGWCVSMHIPERERLSTPGLGKALAGRGFGLVYTGGKGSRARARGGLRLAEDEHAVQPGAPLRAVE